MSTAHLSHDAELRLEWVIAIELKKGYSGTDQIIGLRNAVAEWMEKEAVAKVTTRRLRKQLMPALRFLIDANQPMTTAEIAAHFNGGGAERTQSPVGHFSELRFWGLIQGIGGEDDNRWIPTNAGRGFDDGLLSVRSFLYMKKMDGKLVVVDTPEGMEAPEQWFIHQVAPYLPVRPKKESPQSSMFGN